MKRLLVGSGVEERRQGTGGSLLVFEERVLEAEYEERGREKEAVHDGRSDPRGEEIFGNKYGWCLEGTGSRKKKKTKDKKDSPGGMDCDETISGAELGRHLREGRWN